jgi:allantoin racemase
MRLLVANPNSSEAITESCAALAREAASTGTDVVAWTNRHGPPVIDSVYGDYMAGRPLVLGLSRLRPSPDAVVLAGFGNYGTAAVKEIFDAPVISMAEAAMVLALPLCHRFAIVTTAPRMIPYTEDILRLSGLAERCATVRAVNLPPMTAAPPPEAQIVVELAAIVQAVRVELGADLVILGGSRLSRYAAALRRVVSIPVLEPVACAVQLAEALVRLGLKQSKVGKFASPQEPLSEYGE